MQAKSFYSHNQTKEYETKAYQVFNSFSFTALAATEQTNNKVQDIELIKYTLSLITQYYRYICNDNRINLEVINFFIECEGIKCCIWPIKIISGLERDK